MIDVFLRIAPRYPIRQSLAEAVIHRWLLEPEVRVHAIAASGTYMNLKYSEVCYDTEILPIENFAWESRRYAERVAESERYILADDDHLILGTDWAKRAASTGVANPDYGILAARSVIQTERFGDNWTDISGPSIIPYPYVGCPCIIRKGAVDYSKLNSPANAQDETLCDAMHKAGMKTGFIRGLDYNHLGHGFSQVEPILWMRY